MLEHFQVSDDGLHEVCMSSSRFAFSALLKNVNPDSDRLDLAQRLPGMVRDWLKEHEFETKWPHSRLIGSYGRQTAVTNIKDVDTLLFLPETVLDRTPESVLRELSSVLDDYPDATAEVSPQRRSIRLDFADYDLSMDIVGAVANKGLGNPLMIPDRKKEEWICSDPLGYGKALSAANAAQGAKLIPLIKLVKGWRDQQMTYRRPKSYLLELIVYNATACGDVALKGRSTAENVCDFLEYVAAKWQNLMDEGNGVPRVHDPQLGIVISATWKRTEFETFMRRVRESASAARAAVDAECDDDADSHWKKVFRDLWPTDEQVRNEAFAAAMTGMPGRAFVASSGAISAVWAPGSVRSRPTTFHGATE